MMWKATQNVKLVVVWRSLAMSPFDRAHTTSFNRNYESVLYRFRVRPIANYLSKVANFKHRTCMCRHYWVTPFEFRRYLWLQKTRVSRLSCVAVCVIRSLAVLTQYRRMTDGHTGSQTDDDAVTVYTALPWVSLRVISLLQAFSSAIFCICGASSGPSASAELLVHIVVQQLTKFRL